MKGIVLTDDQLKVLEKRFGPAVRKMGPWHSDGTFGYCWISLAFVERAAESRHDPGLMTALSRLNDPPDPATRFIAVLESFGRSLIESIADVYKRCSFEPISRTVLTDKSPELEPKRKAAAATA